jgi:hypothetical protein
VSKLYKCKINNKLDRRYEEYIPKEVLEEARRDTKEVYICIYVSALMSRRFMIHNASTHLGEDAAENICYALSKYETDRLILELLKSAAADTKFSTHFWGFNTKQIQVQIGITEEDLHILDLLGWLKTNDKETDAWFLSCRYEKNPGDKYSKFVSAPKIGYE